MTHQIMFAEDYLEIDYNEMEAEVSSARPKVWTPEQILEAGFDLVGFDYLWSEIRDWVVEIKDWSEGAIYTLTLADNSQVEVKSDEAVIS